MRLLALVDSPDHVCCRYRIRAFEPALMRAGWSLDCQSLQRGTLARITQLTQADRYDSVLLQRKLLPAWQLAILRRHSRHLVFDFDDAVLFRDSYDRRGPHSAWRQRRFAATVRAADAVIAGNDFLADCASARRIACERVRLIPTCVDPGTYPLAAVRLHAARRCNGRRPGLDRLLEHAARPGAAAASLGAAGARGSGLASSRHLRSLSDLSRASSDPRHLAPGVRGCRPGGRPHRRELAAGRRVEPGKMRPQGASVPGRRAAGDRQPGGDEHRAD